MYFRKFILKAAVLAIGLSLLATSVQARFLQTDPIGTQDQMNLYGYVSNNPLNATDPTGLLQRDQNGKIIFTPTGQGYVGHGGAPGVQFFVTAGVIKTDNGTHVDALRNQSGDARFDCDCHGVTFADSELWINDDQVDTILKGDNYTRLSPPLLEIDPQVGDVAVYRDTNGEVVHSVTVSSVDAKTGAVLVEGLGGLEVQTHIDPVEPGPNGAWHDPTVDVEYHRK